MLRAIISCSESMRGLILPLVFVFGSIPVRAEGLRASALSVDITPSTPKQLGGYGPRRSTGVHDPIHHRVLVLADGEHSWTVVSSEFCVMSPALYGRVARRLERELGIAPLSFWWSLTHTHSAPEIGPPGMAKVFLPDRYEHTVDESYTEHVVDTLVAAVAEAHRQLEPARVGWGWGESRANINRRARDVDGTIRLGMNPHGPVDRKIGLLKIESRSGRLIAHLANYAIHGTVLGGQSCEISGDAPGVVAAYVEEETGAPMLFINGAAGDIAPIYSVYPSPRAGHLSEFRQLLGEPILATSAAIETKVTSAPLRLREIVVPLPLKPGVILPEKIAEEYRPTLQPETMSMAIPMMTLGDDLAVWSAPLELFSEVAMGVRENSPFLHTLYFGYTNGWLGYLLTDEELALGGYEARVTAFGSGAAGQLQQAVEAALRQ